MSRQFLERFKDRMATLGPQGDIEVGTTAPIQPKAMAVSPSFPTRKPPPELHRQPIKATNPSVNEGKAQVSSLPPTSHHPPGPLLHPIREISTPFTRSPQRSTKKALSVPKSVSAGHSLASTLKTSSQSGSPYTPYTLQEYKLTQLRGCVELKGLGSVAGSQDWERKKEMRDRQRMYSMKLFVDNANRLGYQQAQPKERKAGLQQLTNARVRALEFAKSIKLPSVQTQRQALNSSLQATNSDLELKAVVSALKAKLLL